MKLCILSPLFPPDTGAPAGYAKELSERLGNSAHLIIYGYLPETAGNATIVAIDKRSTLPLRLFQFTRVLFETSRTTRYLVNNAPSIELPFLLLYLLKKPSFVLIESDPLALQRSMSGWYKQLHEYLRKHALLSLTLPDLNIYTKAEILPFSHFDEQKELERERWWKEHLLTLTS